MNPNQQIRIEVLIGLPLLKIRRAADMLMMHFGSPRLVEDRKGKQKTVGEWALHVQTNWRITRGSEILFGQADMLYRASDLEPRDDDRLGELRFDERAEALNEALPESETVVQGVACDVFGGLRLTFRDGLALEVFPDMSSDFPDYELWRLFGPGKGYQHLVFEATGFSTK
ncbi:MAG: hypothetical protein GY807_01930 [Gammaproteobacteria bacterium]|nr:hypothetical protein [Gammaproteobacteria bacterium]